MRLECAGSALESGQEATADYLLGGDLILGLPFESGQFCEVVVRNGGDSIFVNLKDLEVWG